MTDKTVTLNVGGKKFRTYVRTLIYTEPDSQLAETIQGNESLTNREHPEIFFDRNGELFSYILQFLRNPTTFHLPRDELTLKMLRAECEYFKLPVLKRQINENLSTFPFLVGDKVRFNSNFIASARASVPGDWSLERCKLPYLEIELVHEKQRKMAFSIPEMAGWMGFVQDLKAAPGKVVVRFVLPRAMADGHRDLGPGSGLDLLVPIGFLKKIQL